MKKEEMNKGKKTVLFFICFVLLFFSSAVLAEENKDNSSEYIADNSSDEDIEDTFIMEDMDIVESIGEGADSGTVELPRDIIKYVPSGNGGVTDILTVAPSIQFDEKYRGSSSAGEIAPANVSISGGNIYDNLFTVDGMNNSSLLDPNSGNPNLASDVSGNPQKFFIDSWLIEDITLYDSDISAKYGDFQGGVVDVKTRKPGKKFSGKVSYKGTNSYLTNYFLNQSDLDNWELGGSQTKQLKFFKNFFSASTDIPITSDGGLLLSYNRNWSTIPLKYFTDWKDQSRTTESYYAKGLYNIDGSSYIDLSASYSPHTGTYFIRNTKDSQYDINGGGYFGAINYVNELKTHKITAHLDYSYAENSKTAPNEYKSWIASKYKDWGYGENTVTGSTDGEYYSREGGFGSIDKEEQSIKASIDLKVTPLHFLGEHKISYGAGYVFNYGRYNRYENAYTYNGAVSRVDVICNGDYTSCVDGDQYFTKRRISPVSDVNAYINNVYAYVEDDYTIERVNLLLGLRLNYEDYMNNFTVSPRIKLSIDLFKNKGTIITGGYSRYYAQALLTYKLREGRLPDIEENRYTTNNEVQDWIENTMSAHSTYKFSDLKTPYTDEFTASIGQKILGSYLTAKYVERHNKDGIAMNRGITDKDGITYYTYNNNARGLYRSVQVKWSKGWKNHRIMTNFTWSMSESSGTGYDDSLDALDMEKTIYYNGSPVKRYELPNDNFARPMVFNVGYVGKFFDNRLTISALLKYRSPYTTIVQVDDVSVGHSYIDPVTGETVQESVSAYEDVRYDHNVTVDLSIYWEQKLWAGTKLTLFAEVYNLFNTQNKIGYSNQSSSMVDDYELGTQLWIGASYEF